VKHHDLLVLWLLESILGKLNNESTPLNSVDEDVSRLEVSIRRPSSDKSNSTTTGKSIILGVDVKPSGFVDTSTGRVLRNGAAIEDAETSAVVGLVDVVVDDVLVVIDGLGGVLENTGLLRVLKITDVPDESNGVTVRARALTITLIEFVVQDEEFLVLSVENPALMSVRSTLVRDLGDDVGDISLVSDIVDSQSIFVISVADITALVALIRTTINKTLRIVDVSIALGAPKRLRVRGISKIEKVKSRETIGVSARLSTNSNTILQLLIDNNIVSPTNRQQSGKVASEILLRVKDNWALGVDLEKLLHVEDLNTVTDGFGSDDDVVLVRADLAPLGGDRVLGQTTKVDELSLLGDFCERSAVVLTDSDKLPSGIGSPSPRGRASTAGATKRSVAQERVKISLETR
jgi:hypothetical protein